MGLAEKKVGFIGAGAMGSAIIRGAVQKGVLVPERVYASDIDDKRLGELARELGVKPAASNEDLLDRTDVVILAVKPQVITPILADLKALWGPGHMVISIAAGVTLTRLEALLPGLPVIRVMPNTPCLVGAGATGIAPGNRATDEHNRLAEELFTAVGEAFLLPEPLLDAVTGLSGSGPAYGYLFIEALADGGVREGLPRTAALRLAAQTLLGAARMVLETGQHPGELKDMVTSPAGTTIAALGVLESRAFRGAVMDAVRTAASRSRELSCIKE